MTRKIEQNDDSKLSVPARCTGEAPALRPSLSIVIPTCNRADVLEDTLAALQAQTEPPEEVIVVDDGSTDTTTMILERWVSSGEHTRSRRVIRQTNAGPAVARNRGIQEARGDLIGFLGDDTVPAPDWVQQHVDAHMEFGSHCAVVGYTGWDHSWMKVTPYLRFINESGAQFGYGYMQPRQEVPYTSFYTSNLSLERSVLQLNRFAESFPKAMWEDAELGYRLHRQGLRVFYAPTARTRHRHRLTMQSFLNRQREVGRHVQHLLALHPELSARFTYSECWWARPLGSIWWLTQWILPLLSTLDQWGMPLPYCAYRATTGSAYLNGVADHVTLSATETPEGQPER